MRLIAPADHRIADHPAIKVYHQTIEPALRSRAVSNEIIRIKEGFGIVEGGSKFARHLCDCSGVTAAIGRMVHRLFSLMLVIVLHRPTVAGLFPHHDISASARPQTGWPAKPSVVLARRCRAVLHDGTKCRKIPAAASLARSCIRAMERARRSAVRKAKSAAREEFYEGFPA